MTKRARLFAVLLACALPIGYVQQASAATNICSTLANYLGSNQTPYSSSLGNQVYWGLYNWFMANC